jgi:hypothetical protein
MNLNQIYLESFLVISSSLIGAFFGVILKPLLDKGEILLLFLILFAFLEFFILLLIYVKSSLRIE